MKYGKLVIMLFFSALVVSGCSVSVSPEMKECMNAHGSLEKYREVIKKYAIPEIMSDITICCTLIDNRIISKEQVGDITYYWEEGTLIETSYEIPSEIIQIIKVGWKDKKIVYLEFLGPMNLHEKKYIKSKATKEKERPITR